MDSIGVWQSSSGFVQCSSPQPNLVFSGGSSRFPLIQPSKRRHRRYRGRSRGSGDSGCAWRSIASRKVDAMIESTEQGPHQNSGRDEQGAIATQEEKVVVWGVLLLPVVMAISTAVMALILAAHSGHAVRPDAQVSTRYFLSILVLFSFMFVLLAILFFFKMAQRKKRTGSIYRLGEELEAWRTRRKKPRPLWLSVTKIAIFGFEAFWFGRSAIANPGHRVFDGIVAIVWLLAAASEAWSVFHPTPSERLRIAN